MLRLMNSEGPDNAGLEMARDETRESVGATAKSRRPGISRRPASASSSAAAGTASPRQKLFPLVGIGAAAGGLEALIPLLRHLPIDTAMGFVLVSPERILPTMLDDATSMRVLPA